MKATVKATEVKNKIFTVELSVDEAATLRAIFEKIGGSPDAGHPRALLDSINEGLGRRGAKISNGIRTRGLFYVDKA